MNHTPGPWSIGNPSIFIRRWPILALRNGVATRVVAYATSAVDARLIAETPRLLETLRNLHNAAIEYHLEDLIPTQMVASYDALQAADPLEHDAEEVQEAQR